MIITVLLASRYSIAISVLQKYMPRHCFKPMTHLAISAIHYHQQDTEICYKICVQLQLFINVCWYVQPETNFDQIYICILKYSQT